MAQLLILDVDDTIYARLRQQAAKRGRTVELEAKKVLESAFPTSATDVWRAINSMTARPQKGSQSFGDSVELLQD